MIKLGVELPRTHAIRTLLGVVARYLGGRLRGSIPAELIILEDARGLAQYGDRPRKGRDSRKGRRGGCGPRKEAMEPLRRVEALRRWREVAEAILPTLKNHGVECYAFGSAVAGRVNGSSDLDILLFVEEEDLHSAEVLAEAEAVLGELAYLLDIKVARIEDREKPPYVWFLRNAVKLC